MSKITYWFDKNMHNVLKRIFTALHSERIKSKAKGIDEFLMKYTGGFYDHTIRKMKKYVKYHSANLNSKTERGLQWNYDITDNDYNPLVSVIVPNYNHSEYLVERLESIYSQTYKKFEVILLDDKSTDDSRSILREYQERFSDNTITVFNDENSGGVFKQWEKGISLANGDLIWIAESDDYCDLDFLEKLVKLFHAESTMISFCRSDFVKEGKKIWSIEEYLADISEIDWSKGFTLTAYDAVRLAFSKKNIIPNVSSCVFRNVGELPKTLKSYWKNMKLSGDWIFYLEMVRGGCISYSTDTSNYYRIHNESTSLKIQQLKTYYEEYFEISKYIAANYYVDSSVWDQNALFLANKAKESQIDINVEDVYNCSELKQIERKMNIVMAVFAMASGGGETYPLYLANQMKELGYTVTVLDFGLVQYKEEIRKLLKPGVPLIRIKSTDHVYEVLKRIGCDIVHTHHGCTDEIIATWISNTDLNCKHVITLHGMYEAIDEKDCNNLINKVKNTCNKFIYIADKNLEPFIKINEYNISKFIKLPNGLPVIEINKLDREDFGIEESAFVLCLVSRAMPEKGWEEAIEALKLAQDRCERQLHLLLIGEGELEEKYKNSKINNVHVLGTRNNVRDFFDMSDVGFLPTRFKGESFPLVVIESLLCGRPVIVTEIAETKNQITDEYGELAGELVHLKDWSLNITEIAEAIVRLANDKDYYEKLKQRTVSAAKKFDLRNIALDYINVYENVYDRRKLEKHD
jgi:glycosyltransferase involved in cell wall biosynthesis